MTPEENSELVRRWYESLNKDGMPSLDLCDKQIEIRNPPEFPVRGPFHGHEGVREWRNQVFEVIDDFEVVIEKVIDADDGQTVFLDLRMRGVASHTRIKVDEPWAAVWRIRNGKLLFGQGYIDRGKALEAAGLSEPP